MSKFFSLIAALFLCTTASAQSTAPTEPQSTTAQSTATVQATAAPQLYPRTQVIEEGTGIWCGACPFGMEVLENLYKEVKGIPYIVIAVHQPQYAYSREPMEVYDYRFLTFQAFPEVWINRKKRTSLFNHEIPLVLKEQSQKTPFSIKTKITKTDTYDYDITLTTTLGFDNHNTTLRMQYVLVEDHVGPYMQANYAQNYAQYFPNSVWLNKPNPAQTYYNDVARAIYPVGESAEREGVLPTEMRRGVPVSQTFHIFRPGSVQNASRLRIVGLLIDTQTNEILNADQQKLPTVVGTSTGIHAPLAPNAANTSDAPNANAPHYDLSGRPISPAQPGLHIVNGKKILDVRGE